MTNDVTYPHTFEIPVIHYNLSNEDDVPPQFLGNTFLSISFETEPNLSYQSDPEQYGTTFHGDTDGISVKFQNATIPLFD